MGQKVKKKERNRTYENVTGEKEKPCASIWHGFSFLERIKGVEPSCSAWEADVLPMNYTRIYRHSSD